LLSFVSYIMVDFAIDPLEDLRASTSPNKEQLIANRSAMLMLDKSPLERYWSWLIGFVQGDFGIAWQTQQKVGDMLPNAISTSVSLVLMATVLAIILGVIVGVVSALRQYTGFDYAITFVSFVLYSLPVFWVAVLLKQYLAIGLNDFLAKPEPNWLLVAAGSILCGLFWMGAIGGKPGRLALVFASATAATFAVVVFILISGWLDHPSIGIVGLSVIAIASAIVVTMLFAGLANRRALYSALTVAAIGIALYYPLQWYFYFFEMDWLYIFELLGAAILVGLGVGWLFGGPDRAVSMRGGALTALLTSVVVFVDRVLQVYPQYYASGKIRGRPIATIGAETPSLHADFWTTQLDRFTHILLPTIALVLISFASYTRYQRGSMLEVMSQDYIRTARAKGLSERVVIMRHALRNALMPLTAIVPIDFLTLIGGAIITETIFGWSGMGKLFNDALKAAEIDPVMAYIVLVGGVTMLANILADFCYGLLDPRIRVNA
jgi:peptide/nickel transport system permease protein